MFIGREKELRFLNQCYQSMRAEFIVLYGRRRVGKTELLNEFCKGKPHVFYSCREYTDEQQLAEFSKMLLSHRGANHYIDKFADWDKAFSYIGELEGEDKTVIVIDEFPYMCKNNASIPSVLQIVWDTCLKNKNIMLIICGSSMNFIEKELLSEKNPLYGRATGIYKMQPMPYYDAVKFVPHFNDEEKIITYAILGGIPHYLKQFDSKYSLKENIVDRILTKGNVLYSEVEFLLRQELREVSVYNTIIEAISHGNTSFNDIYTKTQLEKSKLSVYLKNLIELGIVEREFPVLSKEKESIGSGKGCYELTDYFFRFWYSFGYSNLSYLEKDDAEGIWEDYVEPMLHHYASKAFEKICIDYMYEQNKQRALPFRFAEIGRWWGKVQKQVDGKKQAVVTEIDLLATDRNGENIILGECKFTNAPMDLGQWKHLADKIEVKGKVYYYLYSLNGFTEGLKAAANTQKNIKLVSAKRLLEEPVGRDNLPINDGEESKTL